MAIGEPKVTQGDPFERVGVDRARELISQGYTVIDVREDWEFRKGHIHGARHLPLMSFLASPQQLTEGDALIFVCEVGERSAVAAEMACAMGKTNVINLTGGTKAWKESGLELEY